MDERTFQGYVLKWLGEILDENPSLPFALPEQERKPRGYRKPSDVTLRDKHNPVLVALVGELKLPDAPDGTSPDRRDVVQATRNKADEFQAKWFMTWNLNDLILWDNSKGAVPLLERRFDHFAAERAVFSRGDLDKPERLAQYKPFLRTFLEAFARYYMGVAEISLQPLHRRFATALEVNLRPIIGALHRDLLSLSAKNRPLKTNLERYMTESLEWTLREEAYRSEDLERLARLCAYLLANKLVFYETLRAQGFDLKKLSVPSSVRSGEQLATLMDQKFEGACIASKDYETIFAQVKGERQTLTTDRIAFLSDAAVPAIRDLVSRIADFDFTQLDYDVIGEIYQTLNDPRERHRYGQHYTMPEIADLINGFCVQSPNAKVVDPSCGGGTFLVRGYARKKYLARSMGQPLPPHSEMLQQLFGTDIAAHAVHLTTVNLATRDLVPQPNYPLIERRDFFDLEPDSKIAHGWLPKEVEGVVTNPPYIRSELLDQTQRKKIIARLAQDERKWLRGYH